MDNSKSFMVLSLLRLRFEIMFSLAEYKIIQYEQRETWSSYLMSPLMSHSSTSSLFW